MTTRATAPTISIDELATRLDAGDVAQLWNVLTDDYFTGEMIPGSRRVPLDRVGREAAALDRGMAIVVYCSGPGCPQSRMAADKLAALGFANVRAFEGGLQAWTAAGRPLEQEGAAARTA